MRAAHRFAIAVHILSLIEVRGEVVATSEWMASSIGVNAVIVRNLTGLLRKAGLVTTRQGVPGAEAARPLEEISLLEVFRAVEEDADIFPIHSRPNPDCPVGANIQGALEGIFSEAQRAMEDRLAGVSMAQVVHEISRRGAV
ncbi:Rrf2 family transcriptional regulator [bacterium]|nr:MAG: Rrf2 family transcriptional regulator [bacterium]